MILIKKILILLLAAIMIATLVGCKSGNNNSIPDNSDITNSEINDSQVKDEKQPFENNSKPVKKDTYKETIKSYLTIPEGYVAPVYNGRLIASEEFDKSAFEPVPDHVEIRPYEILELKPQGALKTKMEVHKGEQVWFRVNIQVRVSYGLIAEDTLARDYVEFAKPEVLSFLKAVGAHNIKNDFSNISEGVISKHFEASLTKEMIDMLSNKCFELTLAMQPRNPEYSVVIGDVLSVKLDRMLEGDSVEIIAVCPMDRSNTYAEAQLCAVNMDYNMSKFKPFKELANLTGAEYNEKIDKYLSDIFRRNNIANKIVASDNLPDVKANKRYLYRQYTTKDFESNCAGFNAVLTKAEILRLAEDEDIKVIYLAQQ